MVDTVNDDIRNLELQHQVYLQRLSTATVQKLIVLLDKADNDIVAKLVSRGPTLQGSYASTRLKQLLDSLRVINRDAHTQLASAMKPDLAEIAGYEAGFQKKLILNALPVAWDMVTPTAHTLNAVVNSRPFQGKLLKDWVADLDAAKFKRLRDAVRMGVVQQETVSQIVARVRGTAAMNYRDGIMSIGRRGAEAMIRTAVAHTTTAARDSLYAENSDLISSEQWVATLDTRTCLECGGLDGQTFDVGAGPKTPAHIGCRCIRVPVIKSWQDLGFDIADLEPGTRASMNGQVSATENYSTWLGNQSDEMQDAALGPARAAMFRDGTVDVGAFTNRAGDALTLDQLRAKAA